MRAFRLLSVAIAAAVTAGCLSSQTLVRLQPDGSGTIEQTLLVNPNSARMMLGGVAAEDEQAGPPGMSEADLQQLATRLGRGVRLVSSTPLKEGAFEGTKAVFAFDDINTLELDQNAALPGGAGAMAGGGSKPVTFTFTRQTGGPSVLTIAMNEEDAPAAGQPADEDAAVEPGMFSDPNLLQMMKMMFAGFRMGVDVEVGGAIVRTNADHVAGSRVTLLEVDFDALMADETVFKDLQSRMGPEMSIANVRPFLKNLRGLKINEPVVTIEFR